MKTAFIGAFLCIWIIGLPAREIFLSGGQQSRINYQLQQTIDPFPGIDVLMVSFVVPGDFDSPTYRQKISNVQFNFEPAPREQEEETDARGNLVRKFYWDAPGNTIKTSVSLEANNQVKLEALNSNAPFPLKSLSGDVKALLQSTEQVQSDNPEVKKKALSLTDGSASEMEAVRAVLHFVVDHMRYVLVPEQYDALYALRTGRGNCQNYSHLAAALMRAVGIPVRIVNGITLKKSFEVSVGQSDYSFEMAQGRHSWIEVYFSDLGWVPFDPQQSEFFVSNRYLRIEVGLDNQETVQDGLVRWSQTRGSANQVPGLEEAIDGDFVSDQVSLVSNKTADQPNNILLTPLLALSVPRPVVAEEPVPVPQPVTEPEPVVQPVPEEKPKPATPPPAEDFTKLTYSLPYTEGNLEFPRNFDFLSARLQGVDKSGSSGELKRNFLVETAEYVTGPESFIQVFELEEPILLNTISLAMHNFGGSGQLWLELHEDADGGPSSPAAASKRVTTNMIRTPRGYDWVDFDFSGQGLLLSPGKYWFSLRYSGSPIINWFYSYGKPVGPEDGTRSKTRKGWTKILSFEFNYRIGGLAAKK